MNTKLAHLISIIDGVAERCEQEGLVKFAHDLDVISNTLENNQRSKAVEAASAKALAESLAEDLGVDLSNPD